MTKLEALEALYSKVLAYMVEMSNPYSTDRQKHQAYDAVETAALRVQKSESED